jgi:hypothetical protein
VKQAHKWLHNAQYQWAHQQHQHHQRKVHQLRIRHQVNLDHLTDQQNALTNL